MSYNILGINTSHNGSVCILKDGKIDFFLEEERLSRHKYDGYPIETLKFLSKKYQINKIALSGLTQHFFYSNQFKLYNYYIDSLFPNTPIYNFLEHHHLCHSLSSFYNSKFKRGLGVVIDGNGSYIKTENENEYKVETESIFVLDTITPPDCIYKSNRIADLSKSPKEIGIEGVSLTKVYECITEELGFNWTEAGKTMGLSSYGKFNPNIPSLYKGSKGNKDIINSFLFAPHGSLKNKYKHLTQSSPLSFDLAYKVQQESQQIVGDLIEKFIQQTNIKQVCCAGGYFLNCVANYYLIKRFPDVEFYFEPISSDAGTAIGAAKLLWQEKTQDITIRPQKTLYYGPQYSKEELLEGIKKYL